MKFLKSDIAKIVYLFTFWRFFLFLIAFLSPQFIPEFGARFPYFQERLIATGLPHFIWSFGNFDGVHYLGIAKDGYAYQFTQVFFPFYPLLIKMVSLITFNNYLLAALIVSNVSFLFALIIFFKLINSISDRSTAYWSVLFLLTFPTSFYFGAVYTEGLFFLMIVSAFYLLEKKRNIWASIISVFASATRLAGLFLALSLAIGSKSRKLLLLIIGSAGFILYVLFLKIEFNNPLYFLTAQSIFGQERSTQSIVLLPQVFFRYFKILISTSGLALVNAAFELSLTLLATFLLIAGFKKMKTEWLVFSMLALFVPTLTGTFASMPRYILVAFPIYYVLATIKSTAVKIVLIFFSTIFLIISLMLFSQGYWIA